MSLASQMLNLATRIGTEFKNVYNQIGPLASLGTTNKSNVVVAMNEVREIAINAAGSGGATSLDGLTDVAVSAPAAGHVIRYNGTTFVNVLGTTHFDAAGAAAAAQSASQPSSANLTALAGVVSTAYGRGLLTKADAASLMAEIAVASETVAGKVTLATTAQVVTGTATNVVATPAGVAAALNALVAGAPGLLNTLDEIANALGDDPNFAATITASIAGKQASNANLTALSGLTLAANTLPYATAAGTLALTSFTAYGRTLAGIADAAAARTSLDVYSKSDIGDPNVNLVGAFEAALL